MILLDFSPVSIAAAATIPPDELNLDFTRHFVISSLLSYKKRFSREYGELNVVLDSHNYWRYDYYPDYKKQRVSQREHSKFDWKSFFKYQRTIIDEIKNILPYRFIQVDRCEADDVIGWTALNVTEPTVIVSPDGDFKQCLRNPNVKLYSNIKKKFHPETTLYEIDTLLHKKIMKGDKGDNINNVFTDLMEHEKRQRAVTQRLINYTYENGLGEDLKERYKQNQLLIDFRYIPDEYKRKIEEAITTPITGSKGKVYKYLITQNLNRTAGNWLSSIQDF